VSAPRGKPPLIQGLRAGRPIELDESEVFDRAIERPDGIAEAGCTTRAIAGE